MVFSLLIDDDEFKRTMKNARRNLEIPMPAAMPCKIQREKYMETCRVEKKCKTKYACIVEVDESMRIRMEGSQSKNHEDHIAGRGINSLSHEKSGTQIYSHASSHENSRCKSTGGEIIRKTGENSGMAADESQKQERSDR